MSTNDSEERTELPIALQNQLEMMRTFLKKMCEQLNSKNISFLAFEAKNVEEFAAVEKVDVALTVEQTEEIATFMAKTYEEFTAIFTKTEEEYDAVHAKLMEEIVVLHENQEILQAMAKERQAEDEMLAFQAKRNRELFALVANNAEALRELITRWIETSALDAEEKKFAKKKMALRFEIDFFNDKKKEEMAAFNADCEEEAIDLIAKHNGEIADKSSMELDILLAKQDKERTDFKAKKNEEIAAFTAKAEKQFSALFAKRVEEIDTFVAYKLKARKAIVEAESAALVAVKAEEENLLNDMAALNIETITVDAEEKTKLKKEIALQDAEIAELPADSR